MSTQGLVSVVDKDGTVIAKAIAGCNGHNAGHLVKAIEEGGLRTAAEIKQAAINANFGCPQCLVVLDANAGSNEEPATYRSTFLNARWNPRWARGTAAYTEIVIAPATDEEECHASTD